jgi:hypothetical protein
MSNLRPGIILIDFIDTQLQLFGDKSSKTLLKYLSLEDSYLEANIFGTHISLKLVDKIPHLKKNVIVYQKHFKSNKAFHLNEKYNETFNYEGKFETNDKKMFEKFMLSIVDALEIYNIEKDRNSFQVLSLSLSFN